MYHDIKADSLIFFAPKKNERVVQHPGLCLSLPKPTYGVPYTHSIKFQSNSKKPDVQH